MRNLACILFVFCLGVTYAQNEKPNREAFTLNLPLKGGEYYEESIGATPYFVKDDILQFYPGEKLFIEVETKKTEIISMKVVSQNLNPEKTLEIELTQQLKNGQHEGMILKIQNPFKYKLNYKAMMFVSGHTAWVPTSVIPVQAKLMSMELWPDLIISLVLSDWKLTK